MQRKFAYFILALTMCMGFAMAIPVHASNLDQKGVVVGGNDDNQTNNRTQTNRTQSDLVPNNGKDFLNNNNGNNMNNTNNINRRNDQNDVNYTRTATTNNNDDDTDYGWIGLAGLLGLLGLRRRDKNDK